MELEIKLICARTELIIGEDTPISISVINSSSKSLPIPDIERDPDWPKLRVRDVLQGTERTYGPQDLERAHQHEFLPPPRSVTMTLDAGGSARRDDRLLRWIEIAHAGTYEIAALMPGAKGPVASAPINVNVLPLKLHAATFSAPDASSIPMRNCVWVHEGTNGAVVLFSMISFHEGEARVDFSERVTEVAEFVTPIPSIAPRARLYPAHWFAWIFSRGLGGLYFLQQSPGPSAIPRPIESGQLLSPGLLDWTGATRDKPGRVQVAVWHASPEQPRIGFYLFQPDASIAVGSPVQVSPGDLRWSGAVMMNDGEGRMVLVMQRNDQTHVDIFGHFRVGTVPVTPYSFAIARGTAIGARIVLTREETLLGAVAVNDAVGTVVIPWEMRRNAGASLGQPIVLDAGGARIVRVHLAVGDAGTVLVLGQTADGRWLWGGRGGVLKSLPTEAQSLGVPIAAELSPEGIPFAIMAASETGIRFVSLSSTGRGH
jgi:hypothetical protein